MVTSPNHSQLRRSAAMSDTMPSAVVVQLLDELDRCNTPLDDLAQALRAVRVRSRRLGVEWAVEFYAALVDAAEMSLASATNDTPVDDRSEVARLLVVAADLLP